MKIIEAITGLIALALALTLLPAGALAEDVPKIRSFTNDVSGYCEAVAALNRSKGLSRARGASTQETCLVLCRTDGQAPDGDGIEWTDALAGPGGRYILAYPSREEARAAVSRLAAQDGLRYAEMDAEVTACGSEGVDFRSRGARLMHFDGLLGLAQAQGDRTQTVAVVDSGVSTHSLLRDRMPVYGYDYVDADRDPTNDLFGHGTHVAGIIADCTTGAPVRLYPIRVLNGSGSGKLSNVTSAVLEATEAGVDVINLSLESFVMSQALDDAIESAVDAGVTVVVSAGNHACDTREVCPAHLTTAGVVVVGSVEAADGEYVIADYSNFGDSVDLYACGSEISSCSRSGGYVTQSGTSMAAAHVSSLCALLRLVHGALSPAAMEARLTAVCAGTQWPALDAAGLVPASGGFYLERLALRVGDQLPLPASALPATCHMPVQWTSSDEAVAAIDAGGELLATGPGTATLTATCLGLEDAAISVEVGEGPSGAVLLPAALTGVAEEAFAGAAFGQVEVPGGVAALGERAFADCIALRSLRLPDSVTDFGAGLLEGSEQAVVLCGGESAALNYCQENRLQYIIVE